MNYVKKRYNLCGWMLAAAKFGALPAVMLVVLLGSGLPQGLSSGIANLLAYLPLAAMLAVFIVRHGARNAGIRRPAAADIVIGFLAAVPMAMSASGLARLGTALFGSTGMSEGVSVLVQDTGPWFSVLTLAVVPALCEELLTRGCVFGAARHRSAAWALLLSSLVFAGMHGSWSALFYTFYCGLVLGWMRELTGNVWCGVCAHMGFNTLSVLSALSAGTAAPTEPVAAMFRLSAAIAPLAGFGVCVFLLKLLERIHGHGDTARDPDAPAFTPLFLVLAAFSLFGPRALGMG